MVACRKIVSNGDALCMTSMLQWQKCTKITRGQAAVWQWAARRKIESNGDAFVYDKQDAAVCLISSRQTASLEEFVR